jgi:hypothetical protein
MGSCLVQTVRKGGCCKPLHRCPKTPPSAQPSRSRGHMYSLCKQQATKPAIITRWPVLRPQPPRSCSAGKEGVFRVLRGRCKVLPGVATAGGSLLGLVVTTAERRAGAKDQEGGEWARVTCKPEKRGVGTRHATEAPKHPRLLNQ